MKVRKFNIGDAPIERSPGQAGDVFAGNVIDQRDGGPITIGYGRWGPGHGLEETMTVDDVMVVLEGRMTIVSNGETVTAGPGEIVYMPKGERVGIHAHEERAVTAYVTYPHWQEHRDPAE
jgi:ethanolamine utilization protein EutQ (cupin superfamily)